MGEFQPKYDGWEQRVRDSYARQRVMHTIGAVLATVEPGRVTIELPWREDLTQQHGFVHAGIVSTIADSAGGYAAFSLMAATASVLSVEFKIHLLAPADGERLIAVGRVVRPGRTLTVCEIGVDVVKAGAATRCAWGTQTLIALAEGPRGAAAG